MDDIPDPDKQEAALYPVEIRWNYDTYQPHLAELPSKISCPHC